MTDKSTDKPRGFRKVSLMGKTTFEIDERYTNLKPIGSGSYGLVCSADDTLTGKRVAVKGIHNVFHDLIDAKRVLREIMVLRHLNGHDNVMSMVDLFAIPAGTPDFNDLYLITDLYECDLDRIIQSKQALTINHVQYFVFQLLRGLKYVHSANIIHRDLKPSNLLVNSNCDLAICDFDLARGFDMDEDGTGKEEMTEYVVTRWYRAPELLVENSHYGKEVDMWSVGCIFGELLLRKPMFRGRDYMHQLALIIDFLGSPCEEDLAFIENEEPADAIRSFSGRPGVALEKFFPKVGADALDFLKKLLTFNPKKRLTVDEALAHPFLKELRGVKTLIDCPSAFDFGFEKEYPKEIPKKELQRMMYSEILSMNPEEVKRKEIEDARRSGSV